METLIASPSMSATTQRTDMQMGAGAGCSSDLGKNSFCEPTLLMPCLARRASLICSGPV